MVESARLNSTAAEACRHLCRSRHRPNGLSAAHRQRSHASWGMKVNAAKALARSSSSAAWCRCCSGVRPAAERRWSADWSSREKAATLCSPRRTSRSCRGTGCRWGASKAARPCPRPWAASSGMPALLPMVAAGSWRRRCCRKEGAVVQRRRNTASSCAACCPRSEARLCPVTVNTPCRPALCHQIALQKAY